MGMRKRRVGQYRSDDVCIYVVYSAGKWRSRACGGMNVMEDWLEESDPGMKRMWKEEHL